MTSPDGFSQSKRIPLSVLVRALERNKDLIENALHILAIEDPESTHTEATAVSALLDHWLVNRELAYYLNGQRGDDITALTVIPVNGDYGRGLAALETWIMIDKDELVELLRSRNISVPDNLLNASDPSDLPVRVKDMDGLTWPEITITFIEPEAVRIKARGKSETFTYDAMGFKNRNSLNAKPSMVWDTLRTLAIVTNTDKPLTDTLPPQTDFKRRVSRLRRVLQEFFGIEDEPIRYRRGMYEPAFNLTIEEHVIGHVRDSLR